MSQQSYNDFLTSLEFAGMRVVAASFTTHDDLYPGAAGEKPFKKSLDYTVSEIGFDEDANSLIIDAEWRVIAKVGRKNVFEVKAHYQLVFFGCETFPSDEDIRKFCDSTAKATCYPYFRQFFNQACTDVCVNLPPLPLLKLVKSLGDLPLKKQVSSKASK